MKHGEEREKNGKRMGEEREKKGRKGDEGGGGHYRNLRASRGEGVGFLHRQGN